MKLMHPPSMTSFTADALCGLRKTVPNYPRVKHLLEKGGFRNVLHHTRAIPNTKSIKEGYNG